MLEDSDSEPSESEPLVQQPQPPPRRSPGVWKSSGSSSSSGSGSVIGSMPSESPNTTVKTSEPGSINKSANSSGITNTTSKSSSGLNTTGIKTDSASTNNNSGVSAAGGCSQTQTQQRGGAQVHRGSSSKRLQELVSHLEQVPENEEVDSSVSVVGGSVGGSGATQTAAQDDDEQREGETSPDEEIPSLACPFFGVRNYLHQFYDKPTVKDPTLYEDIFPVSIKLMKYRI